MWSQHDLALRAIKNRARRLAPDVSDELARRTVGILQGAAPSIAAE
jgi:hypothetical protein